MRESDDYKYQPNSDDNEEALFRQTKNRDVQDNPGRYLSSYDLEKYDREHKRSSSAGAGTKDRNGAEKRPPREASGTVNAPKRNPAGQKGKKPKHNGGKSSGRLWLIGIVALILIVVVAVGVKSILHDEETPAPEPQPQTAEKTYTDIFEDTLFFGNSYFITLKTYDLPRGGHFLCKVGLSINQALEYSGDDDLGVLDILKNNGYGHIVLAFGENELGWESEKTFTDEYVELIRAIRGVAPDIKIFVLSVLPVSAEVSAKDEDNTNNPRIREFNEYIRIMAEEQNVVFIPPAKELYDSELNLRSEDSTDGVHLSYEYAELWVNDMKAIMERNEL